jgi:hypothetical protein
MDMMDEHLINIWHSKNGLTTPESYSVDGAYCTAI